MENRHLEHLINFTDFVTIIVVGFAVIIITVLSVWMFGPTNPPAIEQQSFYISVSIDSSIRSNQYDSLLVQVNEELDKISFKTTEEVNSLLQKQEEMYTSFREAESRQNKFLTYASALIAIIAALGGFFGFKSINDIKKSIRLQAEEIMKKEARQVAANITGGSVNQEIQSKVTGYTEANFLRLSNNLENRLNDLNDRIDECCPETKEPVQKVDDQPDYNDNASATFNDKQL